MSIRSVLRCIGLPAALWTASILGAPTPARAVDVGGTFTATSTFEASGPGEFADADESCEACDTASGTMCAGPVPFTFSHGLTVTENRPGLGTLTIVDAATARFTGATATPEPQQGAALALLGFAPLGFMRRRRSRFPVVATLAAVAVAVIATRAVAGPLEDGRIDFFAGDFVAADAHFATAIASPPATDDAAARAFRSITRIAAVIDAREPGPNPLVLDSLEEILDAFGFAETGRSVLDFRDWLSLLPRDLDGNVLLPVNSPRGGEVQSYLSSVPVAEITAALADLALVPSDVAIVVTGAEQQSLLTAFGSLSPSLGDPFTVRHAELKLWEMGLRALRAALLLSGAWSLDVDIDAITSPSFVWRIQDLLDAQPELLTASPQGLNDIAQAGADLIASVDAYLAASHSLRTRSPCAPECFVTIADEDLAREATIRTDLAAFRSSISACTAFSSDLAWFGPLTLDLCGLFGGVSRQPLSWRSHLPELLYDTDANPPNYASACGISDFNGLFAFDPLAPVQLAFGMLRPCGDVAASAQQVAAGITEGTLLGATQDGSSSYDYPLWSHPDVWYRYTAPSNGLLQVAACSEDLGTIISVHTGVPGSSGNEVAVAYSDAIGAGQPGICGAYPEEIAVSMSAGQTVWIRVATQYPSGVGSFYLRVPEPNGVALALAAFATLARIGRRRA